MKSTGKRVAVDAMGRVTTSRSGVRLWLEEQGLVDVGANEKLFPEDVFKLTNASLALLVGRYWSGDGFIFDLTGAEKNTIPYAATSSRTLAGQLQHLLLRLDGQPMHAQAIFL